MNPKLIIAKSKSASVAAVLSAIPVAVVAQGNYEAEKASDHSWGAHMPRDGENAGGEILNSVACVTKRSGEALEILLMDLD